MLSPSSVTEMPPIVRPVLRLSSASYRRRRRPGPESKGRAHTSMQRIGPSRRLLDRGRRRCRPARRPACGPRTRRDGRGRARRRSTLKRSMVSARREEPRNGKISSGSPSTVSAIGRVVQHHHGALGLARLRMAFSSRMASFMVSATKVLIAGSPNAPSMRRPKPPAKPFTPTKPTPSISQRRSRRGAARRRLCRIASTSSTWPHS